eukprot:4693182-Pleurochrysis_carterae.AAC.1
MPCKSGAWGECTMEMSFGMRQGYELPPRASKSVTSIGRTRQVQSTASAGMISGSVLCRCGWLHSLVLAAGAEGIDHPNAFGQRLPHLLP